MFIGLWMYIARGANQIITALRTGYVYRHDFAACGGVCLNSISILIDSETVEFCVRVR